VRWKRRLPAGTSWSLPGVRTGAQGIVGLPTDQPWLVTTSSTGMLERWDLRTGASTATRDVGPIGPEFFADAVADAVVVHRDSAILDVLDPLTLDVRDSFTAPVSAAEPVACQPALCLVTEASVVIVDRRTGTTIRRGDGPALRPGSFGRVVLAGYGGRLTLADTTDGHALPVDDGWRVADGGGYTREVVVAQPQSALGVRIGVLDVATGDIRPIGQAAGWSSANTCLWAVGHVACADGATLRVWLA
jgi:hypothetical protein